MAKYRIIKDGFTSDGIQFKKDWVFVGGDYQKKVNSELATTLNVLDKKIDVPRSYREGIGEKAIVTTDDEVRKSMITTVDVKVPFLVKALPYIGTILGGVIAYSKKSKVGGWIGWLVLGGLTGTVIAIPLAGKAMFSGLVGAAKKDLAGTGSSTANTSNSSSTTTPPNSLTKQQKKDWIVKNAEAVYLFDSGTISPLLDKLSDNELNALYIMGAAPSKFGKAVMSPTADNAKKIKDEFGTDVSTPQFKTDITNAFTKITS